MKYDISIILPFHNSEHTLSESIESILNQSYKKFELLLIDNGSIDNSRSIVEEYAAKDPRIQLLSLEEQNYVSALNTGIVASGGKYIAIMDANDYSHPERLEKQRSFLEKNKEFDLVACCVNYINDDAMQYSFFEHIKLNNRIISYEDICLNRFIGSPLVHPTVMFRKKLADKYELYRQGDFPEDYELWLRLLDKGVKMCKLPEVLLDWKDSPIRLRRTDERYSIQTFYEIKTYYLYNWLKTNNPHHPNLVVWGAGHLPRQHFSLLRDLGIESKFFIDLRANPNYNVIEYTRTPPAGRYFIVCYITNPEAREKIREFLVSLNYTEGKDFICFA